MKDFSQYKLVVRPSPPDARDWKAEKIYKEIAEDDKSLAEDFLSICAEPITPYKAGRKLKRK